MLPQYSKQTAVKLYRILSATVFMYTGFEQGPVYAQKISAGGVHSLLICNDGSVKAWGYNSYGQLGNNTVTDSNSPMLVAGLTGTVTAVSAGSDFSLALKSDGTVWAWGYNYYGQLGNGTFTDSYTPMQVPGLAGVVAISAGSYHSMALKGDGTVWAWGANYNGQLGDNTYINSANPVATYTTLANVTAISAGNNYSMALKGDSTVWTWGSNYDGQLGLGTSNDTLYPCKIPGLTKIIAIDGGGSHSLAVKSNGTVMAWGNNDNGQLGDGTQTLRLNPVAVLVLSNVKKVRAGSSHSLALKNDSTVWQWGANLPLPQGIIFEDGGSVPVIQNNIAAKVPGLSGIFEIGDGNIHALAYKNNETAYGWGNNGSGQIGSGSYNDEINPVMVQCVCSSLFPTVAAGADVTICPGFNTTLTSIASGGNGGPFSYEWSPTINLMCHTCSNAVANPYSAVTYTVVGFDWKRCPAQVLDSVKVSTLAAPQNPIIAPAPYPTICNSNPVTLTASNTSVNYYWMPGGSTASTIVVLPSTNTYYKLHTFGPNGCSAVDSLEVNYLKTNLDKYNPNCFNNNGAIYANPTGGTGPYTYLWSGGETNSNIGGLSSNTYSVVVTDANSCTASETATILDPGPLTITALSKTDVSCNGANDGTATANPAGGSAPYYNYSWAPGGEYTQTVTGLIPGTYTVTVTDASSCSSAVIGTVTITEPVALTSTGSAIANVSCSGGNNGSATVTEAGGNAPYSYVWSASGQTTKTAVNLSMGTYSVLVTDANGCTAAASGISITQPVVLTATISSTNPSCNSQCNGTATAIPAGGTFPYLYSWIPGGQTTATATGLCANFHLVTVTDTKGCTTTQSVTLTQPPILNIIVTHTDALCYNSCDGTATGTATGGIGPYSYIWAPGGYNGASVSGLCESSFTLTATDSMGCIAMMNFAVTQPTALTSTVTKTDASCNAACTGVSTVTAGGGTGTHTYLWLPSGQPTATASFLCAGTHTVLVSDNNNCVLSDTVTVGQPLAVPITVTVTPTSCGSPSGTAAASVSGPGAIPPYKYLWTTGSNSASISGLDAGIYRANVTDGNGCFGFADALITSSNGPAVTVTSVTHVSCFGLSNGAIDISVSGGTAPYTYFWSNGQTTQDASNLSYGPYEVNIKDAAGCLVVRTVSVNQPALIALTYSVVNSGCSATNGSASVIVNGGTSPYSYAWNGGGSAATKAGLGANIYKVTVSDSKGCTDSTMIAVQDSGGPVVLVDTVVAALCGNSGYVLLVPMDSAAINSYQWSTGSTTQNLTNATPGNYGVTITDTSGCKSVLITPVNPVLPPMKPICLVTVDTLTNQNIVVWEKPLSSFIGGFNIYRESSVQGIYQKIGFSTYTAVSTFYDPIADPDVKWARYRISMTDVCGVEGPVSPDHKTIHLSLLSSTPTTSMLVWDDYAGYAFSYYNIYRKIGAGGVWTLIAAMPATITTYTDATFPMTGDTIFYHVDVDHAGGDCNATLKNPDPMATTVKSAKSNSSEKLAGVTSVNELSFENRINIYPNPNNGLFSIELKNISAPEIKIFNVLGEEVKHISNYNNKSKLDVDARALSGGVYYMHVSSDVTMITKKIVVR